MSDTLYRSYSLENSLNDGQVVSSGNITLWENTPASPLNVGDDFRPVPNGPILTVKKVNISDNVIGVVAGKTVRQWQISIEGDNKSQSASAAAQILYNFTLNDNGSSGTMEVTNTGSSPVISLEIGDTFNVPGIGSVFCSEVRGSDSYDDNGQHLWTVTYEGSAALDGTQQDEEALPETKYSLSIDEDSDGLLQKSGSKIIVQEADEPSIDVQVGSTFRIPGIGNVTCTKVSGSDDYTESGKHRWTMTYEGYINEQSSDDTPQTSDNPDTKYSFYSERNSDGEIVHSGSVEISSITNEPPSAYQVGSTISLPGVGEVTCVKVSGSDSYTENGRRKWVMVYEASDKENTEAQSNQYSFDISHDSEGNTVYSGSLEFYWDAQKHTNGEPDAGYKVGDDLSLPVVGTLTCTKVRGSNNGYGLWTFVIEGSRTVPNGEPVIPSSGDDSQDDSQDDSSLPDEEVSISRELNGVSVRSVDGELIILRRSESPIVKKSFTKYSQDGNPYSTIGSDYEGGKALSETIIKETVKKDGETVASYYKHTIEVEA